ncbi:MAG: hypothetical protein MUF51_02220 [Vicinamibacteria bacterium]|jgi:hypothetical protein|nr:hypothetical protein [Vicinamibacteria bacterium]
MDNDSVWRERAYWAASYVGPALWWLACLLFGLVVFWPMLRDNVVMQAWLFGLGVISALIAFASHTFLRRHSARAAHFSPEERALLRTRLKWGRGYGHWRALMRRHQRTWYRGRSHAGERPRYD